MADELTYDWVTQSHIVDTAGDKAKQEHPEVPDGVIRTVVDVTKVVVGDGTSTSQNIGGALYRTQDLVLRLVNDLQSEIDAVLTLANDTVTNIRRFTEGTYPTDQKAQDDRVTVLSDNSRTRDDQIENDSKSRDATIAGNSTTRDNQIENDSKSRDNALGVRLDDLAAKVAAIISGVSQAAFDAFKRYAEPLLQWVSDHKDAVNVILGFPLGDVVAFWRQWGGSLAQFAKDDMQYVISFARNYAPKLVRFVIDTLPEVLAFVLDPLGWLVRKTAATIGAIPRRPITDYVSTVDAFGLKYEAAINRFVHTFA